MTGFSFDLTRQPWIPVSDNGTFREVSICEALVRAHEIDRLAPDTSTLEPVLLRLLLAISIDAAGLPNDREVWADRWRTGRFDPDLIESYLERHRHRFDLFHPQEPFSQTADLDSVSAETKPLTPLLPHVATGNNVPLFSPYTDHDRPPFAASEAARWLLHGHAWDVAGPKSGAAGDPTVKKGKGYGSQTGTLGQFGVILPIGANLHDTLLLNTPNDPAANPKDAPVWRLEPTGPTRFDSDEAADAGRPYGLLDLLTWQTRRIRLIPERDDNGTTVVTGCVLAAGDRLGAVPRFEPHCAWKRKDAKSPWTAVRHEPGRQLWRGLPAMLAQPNPESDREPSALMARTTGWVRDLLPDDYPLSVAIHGVEYGNMQAVVDTVVCDRVPLPVAALPHDSDARDLLERMVADTDRLLDALTDLAGGLLDSTRPAPDQPAKRRAAHEQAAEQGVLEFLHDVSSVARRILAGMTRDPDRIGQAEAAWSYHARRSALTIAERLFRAYPDRAWAGTSRDGSPSHAAHHDRRFRAAVNRIVPADDIRTDAP